MDKDLKTAIANIEDPTLRKILTGQRGLQRLQFALWSASVEQEPVRGQALAVVDAILGRGWRTDTVKAPFKRIEGIPADDWQGMYHVAAKRAVAAEDHVRCLQAELKDLKGRDVRVCLHCGREQEVKS